MTIDIKALRKQSEFLAGVPATYITVRVEDFTALLDELEAERAHADELAEALLDSVRFDLIDESRYEHRALVESHYQKRRAARERGRHDLGYPL